MVGGMGMAILEIRRAGDKVLKQVAKPVGRLDKRIKRLLDDMAETMYNADGVGLAAPQVGMSIRAIVVDVGEGLITLVNPALIHGEGNITGIEGCLSIPGVFGEVERFAQVVVEGIDRHGKKVHIATDGMLAKALQHEIDHLDGILFIDKAKTIQKG